MDFTYIILYVVTLGLALLFWGVDRLALFVEGKGTHRMSPTELGFTEIDDPELGHYFSHKFGENLEIMLEPFGGQHQFLLGMYQGMRLLTPKHRAWIQGKMLLVAGLPLSDEKQKEEG